MTGDASLMSGGGDNWVRSHSFVGCWEFIYVGLPVRGGAIWKNLNGKTCIK